MASAIKGDSRIAVTWFGEARPRRATSTRRDLRRGLPRAGDPQRGQQPVGDFELFGVRRRRGATFAARAIGYGIAGLRVDGNDALAVYAAVRLGRRPRAVQHGPDADRAFHLPRRRPFDLRRPVRYRPAASQGVAAGRPGRAAEGAPGHDRRMGRRAPRGDDAPNAPPRSAPRRTRPRRTAPCRSRATTYREPCSRTSLRISRGTSPSNAMRRSRAVRDLLAVDEHDPGAQRCPRGL